MALTPQDVQNKTFGSSGLGRRGYDEAEVDDFLDVVHDELARLGRDNADLTTKLANCERSLAASRTTPAGRPPAPGERPKTAAPEKPPSAAPSAPSRPPSGPPAQAATADGAAGDGAAVADRAAGILALAQRTADEHVAQAEKESATRVAAATARAESILGEAQARSDQLTRQADERARQVLGSLERDRAGLERRVEELRAFEREYHSRLKAYLEGQLRELAAHGSEAPPQAPAPDSDPSAGSRTGTDQPGAS